MSKKAAAVLPFPERFLSHRPGLQDVIAWLWHADFDSYAEPVGALREQLRAGEPRWASVAALPQPRLDDEVTTARMLTLFHRWGGHVYRVPPALSKPLSGDALGALQLSVVTPPYRCVYLHLGLVKQVELPLDQFEARHELEAGALGHAGLSYGTLAYHLEGAMVYAGTAPSLEILLTFRAPGETYEARLKPADDFRFPTLHVTLDFSLCTDEEQAVGSPTLDQAALVFPCPWEASGEVYELNVGKMRALLRRPHEFEFDSERQLYQLLLAALSRLIPALRILPALTPSRDRLPLLECYAKPA